MSLYSFCFVLCCICGHFQGISPRGAYIQTGDLTEVFCITSFKGLYLEGLIHGRAYFRNFTVYNIRSLGKLATDNLYVLKVICRLEGSPTHQPTPPPQKKQFLKEKKIFPDCQIHTEVLNPFNNNINDNNKKNNNPFLYCTLSQESKGAITTKY